MKLKFTLLIFIVLLLLSKGYAQQADWKAFLDSNSHPFQISDTADFKDLQVLKPILANKRVVLLGEFTHGAKEINDLKIRIIKYLHEQLGYKILLMESGIAELAAMQDERSERTAKSMLSMGLTGPWRTAEFVNLMSYLKENEDLILGGFDPQKSGQAFAAYLSAALAKIDPKLEAEVSQLEMVNDSIGRLLRSRENYSSFLTGKEELVKRYKNLIERIQNDKEKILSAEINALSLKIIEKALENRIAYLEYFAQFKQDNDFRKRWKARDSIMAANILWYINELYPNEKIIISAHNFHVANYNKEEEVMGEFLKAELGNQMYSMGVFAGGGAYANNSRNPEQIEAPSEALDIRTMVNLTKNEACFINILNQTSTNGTKWLYEEITVDNSFINLNDGKKLILKQSFDGLLFIKQVSVPNYNY